MFGLGLFALRRANIRQVLHSEVQLDLLAVECPFSLGRWELFDSSLCLGLVSLRGRLAEWATALKHVAASRRAIGSHKIGNEGWITQHIIRRVFVGAIATMDVDGIDAAAASAATNLMETASACPPRWRASWASLRTWSWRAAKNMRAGNTR